MKPCPNAAKHTKCPKNYFGWLAWAEQKQKTHRQVRCPDCKRYAIWVRR